MSWLNNIGYRGCLYRAFAQGRALAQIGQGSRKRNKVDCRSMERALQGGVSDPQRSRCSKLVGFGFFVKQYLFPWAVMCFERKFRHCFNPLYIWDLSHMIEWCWKTLSNTQAQKLIHHCKLKTHLFLIDNVLSEQEHCCSSLYLKSEFSVTRA